MRNVHSRLERASERALALFVTLSKAEMDHLYFDCLADLLNEGNLESIEELMRSRGAPEPVIRHYVDDVFASLAKACERVYGDPVTDVAGGHICA